MNRNSGLNNWYFKVIWGGTVGDECDCTYLPIQLIKKLKLKPGTQVMLKLGMSRKVTTIFPLSDNTHSNSAIFLSPDLASLCQIPSGQTMILKYDTQEQTLSIGPLIGLFTVRNILPKSEYGSQEPLLRALADRAVDISGLVFVFCPEDINWDISVVKGYIPHSCSDCGEPLWKSLTLPLPNVIYDRIPSRSIEAKPEVEETKSLLNRQEGLFYFNPTFLDKWETHLSLSNITETACYLPPTRLVKDTEDIHQALKDFGSVFLKPTSGSLGKRIIKLTANNDSFSYIYRSRDRQTVKGSDTDLNRIISQLKPVMGSRTYIVQKNLNLAHYQNCTFDIRVLTQKDMFGNWRRTKTYVRVAAPDSFLSNLSDGARTVPIGTVLQEVFQTDFLDKKGLGEQIRIAVKNIPPSLEIATGKVWGELGLDLGIDKKGRIWLIEVNSKPFRTLVSSNGSLTNVKRSLLRPLEFAKFKSGFYKHSPAK